VTRLLALLLLAGLALGAPPENGRLRIRNPSGEHLTGHVTLEEDGPWVGSFGIPAGRTGWAYSLEGPRGFLPRTGSWYVTVTYPSGARLALDVPTPSQRPSRRSRLLTLPVGP